MTTQPLPLTADTQRLHIRQFCPTDAEAIYEYAADPEVTRYMDWPRHESLADTLAHLAGAGRACAGDSERNWALELRASGRVIGSAGCNISGHKASFGYVFAQHAWGSGYATEAARTIVDWLEQRPQIARIWATCDVGNQRSSRVLEKAGLTLEGRLRNWAVRPNLPGQPVRDALVYSKVPMRHLPSTARNL